MQHFSSQNNKFDYKELSTFTFTKSTTKMNLKKDSGLH